MACLDGNTKLEQLTFAFEHEGQHSFGNRTEVVVLEFLTLGRRGAEQRAARGEQIGPRKIKVPIHEKVFLLGSGGRGDERTIFMAEQFQDSLSLAVEGLHRTQQGRFLVECFARPRDKCGRNAQRRAVRILQDVGGAGDVPDRVAAGFERGPDAARGKARTIGLTLNQLLAGELGNRSAVAIGRKEAIVLLGGQTGERIEDVGVVRGAFFDRPVLHRRRHDVGNLGIKFLAGVDRLHQRFVDRFRQTIFHHTLAEYVGCEKLLSGSLGEIQGGREGA